jgi:hypothetical protein
LLQTEVGDDNSSAREKQQQEELAETPLFINVREFYNKLKGLIPEKPDFQNFKKLCVLNQ